MEKNVKLHWKSSKVSLALQPEALVNTSGRVDFSRPVRLCRREGLSDSSLVDYVTSS